MDRQTGRQADRQTARRTVLPQMLGNAHAVRMLVMLLLWRRRAGPLLAGWAGNVAARARIIFIIIARPSVARSRAPLRDRGGMKLGKLLFDAHYELAGWLA